MPFGNSMPNRKRMQCLRHLRFSNPKGIVSSSPRLRGTSYLGSRFNPFSTPTGLRHFATDGSHEVHRVNSRVRDALKGKGLLGAIDITVQSLIKHDLTNAQKRDARFYPNESVIVFNQKVSQTMPGANGKLLGIIKTGVLVEVDGQCVTVANKLLDKITVCLPLDIPVAAGDRLHLKANRKLTAGARTSNGELVTVKTVRADGGNSHCDMPCDCFFISNRCDFSFGLKSTARASRFFRSSIPRFVICRRRNS